MSVFQGVLIEEIGRSKRNVDNYQRLLNSLPRGTIFVRKIGNDFYVYRKRKEAGKVISQYLGKEGSVSANEGIKLSEEYKRIKNNLKIAKLELEKLERAYRVYDWKREKLKTNIRNPW